MKLWKRLTALLLGAACLCVLITVPPAEAAGTVSTFPDVTDPQVGRAVEALRVMGVIDGSGDGRYNPDGNLTRAAFCKMAILAMGKGDEADAQASRTIFNDVPATHWARGYVNLAALTTVGGGEDGKGGSRLMLGLGNGSFAPNRVISYGEAVTILLRILGYTKQASLNWPNGAVSTAASVGLTAGFTPPGAGAPVTRAQAALLFCNMLTTPISGDKETTYLKSQGYTVEPGSLLLASDTKTESGLSGAVKVFSAKGSHNDAAALPAVRNPASFLEGARGTAVFDQKGRFLTFLPDRASASKTITVASASGGVLTATDGTKLSPSSTTKVWIGGSSKDFAEVLTTLNRPGTSITVCFTDAGAIDYLFVHGTSASLTGGVMVAKTPVSGNPFAQLTAGTNDYKILKNGVEVTTSALRQYDVAAYDPTNKTLYVTDFRLTGVYEKAYPSTAMPTEITVLGKDLDVLASAVNDLKNLKLNSSVTLLFSPDGKVAGAVSASTLHSNTMGFVSDASEGNPTITLLNAPDTVPTVSGKYSGNLNSCLDCLVTVTGGKDGEIYLSRMGGRIPSKPLDVRNRTLGDEPLAENLVVFDRIANNGMKRVSLADVAMDSVPAGRIAYQRTNSAGKVDLIVLDNVTGDLYTYGIVKTGEVQHDSEGGTYVNRTTTVTNSSETLTVVGGTRYQDNQFIGLAKSVTAEKEDGFPRSAGSVALKSVEKVSPRNFNLTTNTFFSRSIELPISNDVQCYNTQTKTWFGEGDEKATPMENLNACLAYSSNLTVYYDRDPAQGGKVRVVVAN